MNKKVLAIGVFDLFHVGHLRYLEYAKRQGTQLIVAVTPDAICQNFKNKAPLINESQRLEIVQALDCTDIVDHNPCSLEKTLESVKWISQWEVNHVVVGGDWEGSERWERLIPLLAEKGITVDFAPRTENISTSDLVLSIKKS